MMHKKLINRLEFLFKYYIIGKRMTSNENNVVIVRNGWFGVKMPLLETLRHEDGSKLTDQERLEINADLRRTLDECK